MGTHLSAHELQLGSKLSLRMLDEPLGRIETVLRALWKRVLGCKAVAYRYDGHIRAGRDVHQHRILAASLLQHVRTRGDAGSRKHSL